MPGQMPHQMEAPPKQYAQQTQNVPVPQPSAAPQPSTWADISEYEEIQDWAYIVVAVVCIEVIVLFLVRFFPDTFGKVLNVWYNRFKLSAVIADIVIILIGFAITRYVYTEWIYPTKDWNPSYFTGTLVGVQVIHDILFYLGVIRPVPQGQNAMMDVFKEYSEGGAKIIAGDSAMMIGSSVLAMVLKSAAPHLVIATALLATYAIPFVLETRNNFSGIA
jgi:uncharacterized membrane protein YidH (DUF202 family)